MFLEGKKINVNIIFFFFFFLLEFLFDLFLLFAEVNGLFFSQYTYFAMSGETEAFASAKHT